LTPILKPSKFPAASLVQNARSAANDKVAVGKIAPKGTLALLMFITPLHLDSVGCVDVKERSPRRYRVVLSSTGGIEATA